MLKHVLIYAPAKIVPAAFALLSIGVFTRALSIEQYGYFALTVAAAMTFDGFFGQWLIGGIMRFHARQKDGADIDQLLASCGLLFLLPALLICAAGGAILLAFWSEGPDRSALLVALPYFFVYSLAQLVMRVHMASLNSARFAALHLTQSAVSAIVAIGLATQVSPTPLAVVLGMMSGFLIILALDWRTTLRLMSLTRARRERVIEIVQFAWPTILAGGFSLLTSRMNRFLVLMFLGPTAVGLLNAAQALTEQALSSVFMIVAMAAHPMTVKIQEHELAEALQNRLRGNAVWTFGLGLPSAVGFALLAPELATLFLGESYRETAIAIVPLVTAAAFLNALRSHFLVHSFFLASKVHYNLCLAVPVFATMLAANYVLIPAHGILGAVLALLVTEMTAAFLAFGLTLRAVKMPVPQFEIGRIVIGVFCMAAAIHVVPTGPAAMTLLLKFFVGLGIYGLAGLILNIGDARRTFGFFAARRILNAR